MKSTGIVRTIDKMGRFVIPKELRKTMDLTSPADALEVFVDDDKIVLRKYSPSCIFCQSLDNVVDYAGKKVCAECIRKLYEKIDTSETAKTVAAEQ